METTLLPQALDVTRDPGRLTVTVRQITTESLERLLQTVIEAQQMDVPTLVFRLAPTDMNGHALKLDSETHEAYVKDGQLLCKMIERAGKFSLAVMEGDLYDEFFEIALACHLRIAQPGMNLGFPNAARGRIAQWGSLSRLIRLIGKPETLRFLTLTPTISLENARELKMVDRICAPEQVSGAVEEICQRVAHFDAVTRSLLIRNFGIGEEDTNTLDRFEAFHARSQRSPYRPNFEFSNTPSANVRKEDATRNFSVVFNKDLEGEQLRLLEKDQVAFLFRQLMDAIDFEIKGRVIELGAGCSWLTAAFSRLPGVTEVVAVELSDNELLIRAPVGLSAFKANMDKIKFVVGNFNAAHYEPESFDVVAFARALHHSNDPRETLRQAHRLLKPGGRLIAFDEHILPNILSRERKRAVAKRTTVELTKKQYRRLFEEIGFSVRFIPYFRNHYRWFWRFSYNDRYLVQFTPRRWLNGLFYANFHVVGTKSDQGAN